MGNFFNMDSPFVHGMSKIVDLIWLSILWLIFCIPVFTIGAACSAMHYSMNKAFRHDRGYITSEFWYAFKTNFKFATPIWLVSIVGYLMMALDLYLTNGMEYGAFRTALMVIFALLICFIVCWNLYTFAYICRFENTRRITVSNAGKIAIAELPWTAALFIILLATVCLCFLVWPLVMIAPAMYAWIANVIIERIFRKYMSAEDREAEAEKNNDYHK